MEHHILIPPGEYWHCSISQPIVFASFLISTWLLVSMTFDRFYSIIKPHKAASFNSVKRAKITIVCVIILCIFQNIPFGFLATYYNWQCWPHGRETGSTYVLVYYLSNFMFSFALPFVLLLTMNSIIIHKLRTRSIKTNKIRRRTSQIQKQSSEKQIFAMLLLVTFAFLILITPKCCCQLYMILVDFVATPNIYAGYYLF